MLSHSFIGVNDFERALHFYAAVMQALGHRQRFVERARPWAGWQAEGQARPLFLIGAPHDGAAASTGNGQMVALLAPDRAAVRAAHAAGLAAGGSDAGAPGPRPEYHADYYGAYLRDPEGNKIGLACHDPAGN
ncbi:VOC family protein [Fertoebacter nigrum]|uniref:VOC family protein n=1 Tax=Fertoeibacter niger TaxID=2656921 RepID=A0A8X8GT93_9RHOB|nr:VOC family protein [Fertoeibacter niger]NUB43923.1 VOC family protein [Fertoeibacter niger]